MPHVDGAAKPHNGAGVPHELSSVATPARLTLRRAGRRDIVPLTFFFDAMLRRDYFIRRGQLAEMIASDRHKVLVAEIDCVLVGVVVLTRGARLVNALVHPAYRGLGIGRALIDASRARQVRVKLDAHAGDPRGFYERLGFRTTGQRSPNGRVEIMTRPDAVAPAISRWCSAGYQPAPPSAAVTSDVAPDVAPASRRCRPTPDQTAQQRSNP